VISNFHRNLAVLACLMGLFSSGLHAQYTPKPGTAERTAILDVVRFPLQADVNQSVVFVVKHMKVQGDWAFLIATPETKSSERINYRGTKYEEVAQEVDEITIALLKRKGGKWVASDCAYFSGDVWWWGLWERYPGCPRSIFP
jgi:hypothetical protein